MRGKREAGNREEAGLPQGTEKEELHVTGSPIGSGMTAEVASGMTKNKKETPKADSESGRSSISSFPRRRESGKGDESGRSMVETLGVLAIMGLLAVGGVMAYRYAVTKYQANETFNELRRRVIVHSQQSIVGTPLSQVELGDETQLGYPIDVAAIEKGFFELTVSAIDKDLCREVVRTGWTLPTQTRVNGIVVGTNPEACGEENSLVFRFQTEMGGCKADEECPCGTCANGVCQTTCGSGESCVKDFNDGQYVCCPGGSVKGKFCCETVNEAGECCDADGNCCPPDKPLIDADGKCWACDDEQHPAVRMEWNGANEVSQTAIDRCAKCDNRKLMVAVKGWTHCSIPCPEGQIWGTDGKCHDCDEPDLFDAPHSECFKCPNRFVGNTINCDCGCYHCSDTRSIKHSYFSTPETYATCQKCPGRIQVDGNCTWPCPTDKPVMSSKGECHTCDEAVSSIPIAQDTWEECLKCDGIRFIADTVNWPNSCRRCDDEAQSIKAGGTWQPEWMFLTCNGCPNRRLVNAYCAKPCTDGKIWDNVGQCHTCDEEEDFNVQGVPENKCACPGVRYLDGDICKKCPEDLSALTPEQKVACQNSP